MLRMTIQPLQPPGVSAGRNSYCLWTWCSPAKILGWDSPKRLWLTHKPYSIEQRSPTCWYHANHTFWWDVCWNPGGQWSHMWPSPMMPSWRVPPWVRPLEGQTQATIPMEILPDPTEELAPAKVPTEEAAPIKEPTEGAPLQRSPLRNQLPQRPLLASQQESQIFPPVWHEDKGKGEVPHSDFPG